MLANKDNSICTAYCAYSPQNTVIRSILSRGVTLKWGPKRGLSQNGDRIPSRAPLSPLRAVTAPIYVQLAEQVAAKGFKW